MTLHLCPPPPSSAGRLSWTPDSCALAVTWQSRGVSVWSVFGTLLTCSLAWEEDVVAASDVEWGAEGYQLWVLNRGRGGQKAWENKVMQMAFVKSALSVNPCMVSGMDGGWWFGRGDNHLSVG